MLNDVVMDGDVHVVKDVESILFIKVRLEKNKDTKVQSIDKVMMCFYSYSCRIWNIRVVILHLLVL